MGTHVEDEEGVFRVHRFAGAIAGHLEALLVPPRISTLLHADLASGSAEDEDVLDERALAESSIDDRLRRDGLASSPTLTTAISGPFCPSRINLLCGDEYLALAVVDTVTEGFR
jgi:hypothetical protein